MDYPAHDCLRPYASSGHTNGRFCKSLTQRRLLPDAVYTGSDARWSAVVQAVHGHGARIVPQLWHVGAFDPSLIGIADLSAPDYGDAVDILPGEVPTTLVRGIDLSIEAGEFVRRFLLHVLPSGFQRIRHYGWLANRSRAVKLERCRHLLDVPAPVPVSADEPADYRDRYQRLTGVSLWECPHCHCGRMVCVETLQPGALPRGPPEVAA